jgi:hypothetical protein
VQPTLVPASSQASSRAAAPPEQLARLHSRNPLGSDQAAARMPPCRTVSGAAETGFADASRAAATPKLMAPSRAVAVPSVQRPPPGFEEGMDADKAAAGFLVQLDAPMARPCDLHPSQVMSLSCDEELELEAALQVQAMRGSSLYAKVCQWL